MDELVFDGIFYSTGNKQILKGCYMKVSRGFVTALTGRNGSGKTTLFKVGTGMLRADSGITTIGSIRLNKKSIDERYKHVAYLPQEFSISKEVKVRALVPALRNCPESLAKLKDQKIKSLSKGEKRFLEILFILSLNKPFVILDEPFTGLSPIFIEQIIEELIHLKSRGTGIVISDHYKHYINHFSDVFYEMEGGQTKLVSRKH